MKAGLSAPVPAGVTHGGRVPRRAAVGVGEAGSQPRQRQHHCDVPGRALACAGDRCVPAPAARQRVAEHPLRPAALAGRGRSSHGTPARVEAAGAPRTASDEHGTRPSERATSSCPVQWLPWKDDDEGASGPILDDSEEPEEPEDQDGSEDADESAEEQWTREALEELVITGDDPPVRNTRARRN